MNANLDPSRPNEPGDEQLDRLLATARWPELDEEAVERLRAQFEARRRRPLMRLIVGSAALAAAAAVVVVTGLVLMAQRDEAPRAVDADTRLVRPAPRGEHAQPEPSREAPATLVRDASLRELMALGPRARAAATSASQPSRPVQRSSFDDLLMTAATPHEGTSPTRSIMAELERRSSRDLVILRLHRVAVESDGPKQLGAVGLLAQFGGRESLAVLLRASRDPELRPAAMPGVLRLADAQYLAALARKDTAIRRDALRALARRGDARSAELFVGFVLDASTRSDALAALHGSDHSSSAADGLIGALDHPRVEYRLAAARALGAVCGEGVGPRLRRMVRDNVHRREALAALMYCRDPDAARFLAAAASRQPGIEVEMRVVRSELQRLF